jgi:hypothetical protein
LLLGLPIQLVNSGDPPLETPIKTKKKLPTQTKTNLEIVSQSKRRQSSFMLDGSAKAHSWFEKMSKPNDRIMLRVEPLGLYNFPDEFKIADAAGYFEYSIRFRNLLIHEAKFNDRQQTEEELWLIEEEKAAKTKGKKKAGEGPTPEELEKKAYFDNIRSTDEGRL